MVRVATIVLGIAFGFLLSRGRATDYDAIASMFRFEDAHLALLMMTAIGTAALGLFVLHRTGARALDGTPVKLDKKPMHRGVLAGGLIFGAGWGIAGQCPGTALGQVGEGKWLALVTIGGMLVGTWLFGVFEPRLRAFMQPTPKAPPAPSSSVTAR